MTQHQVNKPVIDGITVLESSLMFIYVHRMTAHNVKAEYARHSCDSCGLSDLALGAAVSELVRLRKGDNCIFRKLVKSSPVS